MKDQVTVLMEALRLVGIELERYRRRRQAMNETLDRVENLLDDPKVAQAIQTLRPMVDAPPIVPDADEDQLSFLQH